MNAEKILITLIQTITQNLEELASLKRKNSFVYGEKTAYVECLEILQMWQGAPSQNLNYNVQQKYLNY